MIGTDILSERKRSVFGRSCGRQVFNFLGKGVFICQLKGRIWLRRRQTLVSEGQ